MHQRLELCSYAILFLALFGPCNRKKRNNHMSYKSMQFKLLQVLQAARKHAFQLYPEDKSAERKCPFWSDAEALRAKRAICQKENVLVCLIPKLNAL